MATFPSFCFSRKVTSRVRITTNVDQGFPTIQNFQPKKLTNQKTAGTKSLSLYTGTIQGTGTIGNIEVHIELQRKAPALFRAPALVGTTGIHMDFFSPIYQHYSGHPHYWEHRGTYRAPAQNTGTIQGTGTSGNYRGTIEFQQYQDILPALIEQWHYSTGTILGASH